MDDPTPPASEGADLLAEIAASTVQESAAAVPLPSGPTAATLEPVDRWGRKFDPSLHLTDKHGRPALRRGRTLIMRRGAPRPDSSAAVSPPTAPPIRARLAVEDADAASQPDAGGVAPAGAPAGEQLPPEQLLSSGPGMEPAEFERRARAGARLIRKAAHRLGRAVAGDEGDYLVRPPDLNEGREIEDATFDAQMEAGRLIPAAAWIFLAVALGGYAWRVSQTQTAQGRWDDLWARWTGKRPRGRVIEQPATEQAAAATPQQAPTDPTTGAVILHDDPFSPRR